MEGVTPCIGVCMFILFAILIGLNSAWIYVGTEYQHEPCQLEVKPVSLSKWLIVHGGIHIAVYSVSAFLAVICYLLEAMAFMAIPLGLIMVNGLFDLAWFIVGIVILVNAEDCHHVADHLWNTLLVAVILAGLGVFSTQQASNKNNNESN